LNNRKFTFAAITLYTALHLAFVVNVIA
jgi:hypothetical protein